MNSIQKTETQEPTMSSREIAEITGKRHDHILRDIRKMFDDLEISSAHFWGAYTDGRGNTQPCFNLNRHYTEVLLTGYDVKRRAAVIKRWYSLETGAAQPLASQIKDPETAAMIKALVDIDAVRQKQPAKGA